MLVCHPAEDVFLNLGMKDGSTDHCDQLLIKIKLPNTQLKDISLDVLEKRLICSAPKYKLNLALPHPVLAFYFLFLRIVTCCDVRNAMSELNSGKERGRQCKMG